ncbi:MAG: S9 family peptidase [Gemmatimonadota bacterium]|jgi:dipeptidyl aminopeptidase/acylaminoacyl peptidase
MSQRPSLHHLRSCLHLALIAFAGVTSAGISTHAAAQQTPPRTLMVDDLFNIQRVGSPRVSPDGAWVVYTVARTSLEDERTSTRIWMAPAAGGDAIPMTAEGGSASAPAWSPDGRYLTFLASRNGDETQVWALDRRGGEAFALTDVKQGVAGYAWSPDASRLLLTLRDPDPDKDAERKKDAPRDPWVIDRLEFKRDGVGYLTGDRRTHLYVLDLASNAMRQLTTGRWDEEQAAWSPDGERVAFVSTRTEDPDLDPNAEIWLVDADRSEPTDSPTRLTHNPGADGQPTWSPDGRSIAYVTATDVDAIWYATSYLAVIPAQGGEPRLLTEQLDRNPSRPRYSADGRWIWFGLEDSAEDHVARIHPDGSGLERPVSGPLSAGSFDFAAGTFAVAVGTLERPAEIWVADAVRDGGNRWTPPRRSDGRSSGEGPGVSALRRLTHHNDAWLAEIDLGETRNVHFSSADGTGIEGFVAFPPDYREGEQRPLLLRIHGGPVSQYSHAFNFEARLLAANGYVVLYTNPRGSSGYGQAFSEAIFADWGNKDFQDVMAGVDYVLAQGWGDPDRMGVGGWSYGGILTDYVITQSHRFKGAISGASEVLYVANYGHDHYQWYWEHELGLPWKDDNRATWERISPFNHAQDITTPTLIMGGEEDWNVPIQNGEQLYQVLRRRGVPTQLVVYPGQGHGIRVPSYQKDRYERYLAWYDRWVKSAGKPVS